MLATIFVLCLIVAGFWRSLFRLLIAALLVFVIVGGVVAVHAIDAAVNVNPQHQIE